MDTPRLPTTRYRLVKPLETDGAATTWYAHDEQLNRRVEIRVYPAAEEMTADRIRAELRAVALVSHRNVITIVDHGATADGAPYVVSGLVDGSPLAAILATGPLPWQLAVEVCANVADGLSAVHATGLVHNNVNPANILITDEGAKLGGFGLSTLAGERTVPIREPRAIAAAAYAAPERLTGAPAAPPMDVYGLGIVLYQALTGVLPSQAAPTDSAPGVWEPAPLPPIDGVPAAVSELCLRCLRPAPGARPTAARLARRLSRTLRLHTADPVPTMPETAAGTESARAVDETATGTVTVPLVDDRAAGGARVAVPLTRPTVVASATATPATVPAAAAVAATPAEIPAGTVTGGDGTARVVDAGPTADSWPAASADAGAGPSRPGVLVGALTLILSMVVGLGFFLLRADGAALRWTADAATSTDTTAGPVATGGFRPVGSPSVGPSVSRGSVEASPASSSQASPSPTADRRSRPVASASTPMNRVESAPTPAPAETPSPSPRNPPCAVHVDVKEWGGGANLWFRIANTSADRVDGWTLTFAVSGDLRLGRGWNGRWRQSGHTIIAYNVAYNAVIEPGSAITGVGVMISGRGDKSDQISTRFMLNGHHCATT